MTRFCNAVLAAALLSAAGLGASGAAAEPLDGFYIGAGAGLNFAESNTVRIDALAGRAIGGGVSASVPATLRFAPGAAVAVSAGYGFGNGLRFELEGSFRQNGQSGGGGVRQQAGVMGNVLFDIDIGESWVVPYIGFGGGYQAQSWRSTAFSVHGVDTGAAATAVTANQSVGGLAYQVIAGAAFPVPSVPGLSLTAEYRYAVQPGSHSYRAQGVTPGVSAGQPSNATRVRERDGASHSIMLGLRFAFDAPDIMPDSRPPLAAFPAPAALPARSYLIYFDWNRADLTPRAREVIAEAVRNSTKIAHTLIEVTGHADASGSAKANQALSLRRAEAVAAELRRWGVAPESIALHAVGDTSPLVPNIAGVRAPQNRVVEVVYR